MIRRDFLKTTALAAASAILPTTLSRANRPAKQAGKASKPNILFIFTDQQTYHAMSGAGNPYLYTPAMDSLAAIGATFRHTYCSSPVSGPARSSLITSRMPHETRVNFNDETPDWNLPNMGTLFRQAGYHTVWCGKWHLPHSYPHAKGLSEVPGFDVLDFKPASQMSGKGYYTDSDCADAAVRFIKNAGDQPFLLGVSLHNPHDICYVPREPEAYPLPLNADCLPPLPDNFEPAADEPEFLQQCRNRGHYGNEISMTHHFTAESWRNYIFHYYRMTERVDREIGKVLDALEYMGIEENTLVLFTSDHGDGCASHRWAAKLSLYEEAVRIPFIVAWPGKIAPRQFIDIPASQLDVLPTLCDYAGIEVPASLLGKSLRPLLEGQSALNREYIVTELAPDPQIPAMQGRMVRWGNYKYNRYSTGKRNEQLFDLAADPGEKKNLAYDPDYQEVVKNMKTMLTDWNRRTADPYKV